VAVLEYRLKKHAENINEGDLANQAKRLEKEYNRKAWKSYLTVHFPNCAWVQPNIRPEKKRAYVDKVLQGYKTEPMVPARPCSFCGRPATALADRSHIPLLTGETTMASGAGGAPGLPVCGYCICAIHFYPLATLKVAGRPLFWWAPEQFWMLRLTQRFCHQVEKVLAGSSDEFANLRWPSTQLLHAARDVLDEVESEHTPRQSRPPLCDVIGVHATNYGAGPDYDELRIPCGLLEFWSEAGNFGDTYRQIENEAWVAEEPESTKTRGKKLQKQKTLANIAKLNRKNRLYEALGNAFRLPDYRAEAKRVALQFFLRRTGKNVAPNTTALAGFFLEKVAGMEKQRLEAIREMADTIADHLILANRDRRVAWHLFKRRLRLGDFLQCLSQIQRKLSDAGHPFEWDKILLALGLSNEEDRTSSDHWLVQDLILIRVYEKLAKSEVLAELPEAEEPQTTAELTE
jgi:CRISPR-associated protein Cst1